MKKLLLAICIIALSGCSTVKFAAKYATDEYCDRSEHLRLAVRQQVELAVYPNSIRIDCELTTK